MNKKLKRYLEEIDRTEEKIAELQGHLKNIRAAQKQEEDLEIVRSIRGMKLSGRDLFALLNGLQDGTLKIREEPVSVKEEKKTETGMETSEREEKENEDLEEME